MVRRYDLVSADRRDIEESPDGYFVEYEDYAALEQHYAECHAAWLDAYEVNKDLQRRIDVLQRDLEHIQRGERGS